MKEERTIDIIYGGHSIQEALKNPARKHHVFVATHEAMTELKKSVQIPDGVDIRLMSSHQVQEQAKAACTEYDYNYQRVPSQMFLVSEALPARDLTWLYDGLTSGDVKKILCLDQVTDVHNGAAIMRTASFYNVDAILLAMKGDFGMGPSFTRISSGSLEHLEIVKCSSLPKALTKLQNMGVYCLGLSEHETVSDLATAGHNGQPQCLVLGAEDVGLSHAIKRVLPNMMSIASLGAIKSLNVSVAAAIAMDRFFSAKNS